MKIRSNKKKHLFISLAVVALLLVCAYLFITYNSRPLGNKDDRSSTKSTSDKPSDNTPPTQEEVDAGTKQKEQTVESQPQKSLLNASISALNKTSSTLQIRTLINKVTSGTCTLYLQKNNVTVTKTASIQSLASTSTCQGFDIPLNDLTSGDWSVKITITSPDGSQTLSNHVAI